MADPNSRRRRISRHQKELQEQELYYHLYNDNTIRDDDQTTPPRNQQDNYNNNNNNYDTPSPISENTPFQSPEHLATRLAPRPAALGSDHQQYANNTNNNNNNNNNNSPSSRQQPFYQNNSQETTPERRLRDRTADFYIPAHQAPQYSDRFTDRLDTDFDDSPSASSRNLFTRADDRSPLEKLQLELKHIGKEEGFAGGKPSKVAPVAPSGKLARSLSKKQADRLTRSTSLTSRITSRNPEPIDSPSSKRRVVSHGGAAATNPHYYQNYSEENLTSNRSSFAERAQNDPYRESRKPYRFSYDMTDHQNRPDVDVSPVSSLEDNSAPVQSRQAQPQQRSLQPDMEPQTVTPGHSDTHLPDTEHHNQQHHVGGGGSGGGGAAAYRGPDYQYAKPNRHSKRWHMRDFRRSVVIPPNDDKQPMHRSEGDNIAGITDNLARLTIDQVNLPENVEIREDESKPFSLYSGLILFPTSPETPLHAMVLNPLVDRPQVTPHIQFTSASAPATPSGSPRVLTPIASLTRLIASASANPPEFKINPYFQLNERDSPIFPTLTRSLAVRSVPTAATFQPHINIKCGPLLRYVGLRKVQTTQTHLDVQNSGHDNKYFWRGTIMIVTTDEGSNYDEAPHLKLFAQSSSLGMKNNLDTPPRSADGGKATLANINQEANRENVKAIADEDGVIPDTSMEATPAYQPEGKQQQQNGNGGVANNEQSGPRILRGKDGSKQDKFDHVEATRLLSERGVTFWRFHIEVELSNQQQRIAYQINEGKPIGFWVPSKDQSMKIMFYSCNGFSASVKPEDFCGPDPLWRDVLRNHAIAPYHVMLGGGDQLYMDSVMNNTTHFKGWLETHNPLNKYRHPFSEDIKNELEVFYLERYCMWFAQGLFGLAASQIAQCNIYDDHDIIDGYGSYADHFNSCPVFAGLGKIAYKYYLLFQHHTMVDEGENSDPSWILGEKKGPYIKEYSRSTFMHLGKKIALLGLDCRTERTRETVVTDETYARVFDRLSKEIIAGETKHLLVLLGVPIAYPRMVWLEDILTSPLITPIKKLGNLRHATLNGLLNRFDGAVELLDDMMDHWTARGHKRERNWFILELQKLAVSKNVRVTILGGDVHLASFGYFYSKPSLNIAKRMDHRYMINVVSSAIVNTPPPNKLADFLNKRATKSHKVGKSTEETQIKIFFSDPTGKKRNNNTMLPARNYCTISENITGQSLRSYRDVIEPDYRENDEEADRVEGLDIVISAEIDQHDPAGKTRDYGMTVPALECGYISTSELGSAFSDASSSRQSGQGQRQTRSQQRAEREQHAEQQQTH